jgi:hypothetical protein
VKKLTIVLALLSILLITSAALAAENVMLDRVDFGSDGTDADRDRDGWGRSATDETGGGYGGIGSGGCRLVWDGADDDPNATIALYTPKGAAKDLTIRHLDGLADDSFNVEVQHANGSWVDVGSYSDQYTTENWLETNFDLSGIGFGRGRDFLVRITATGPKWSGFPAWGQLCIDWIELYGDGAPR